MCPLGTCSVLAPVSQNNTVSTIRNTEVCSDSTTVLALECALRRKSLYSKKPRSNTKIKLCNSSRVLRAQVIHEPAAFPHFRLFALCTAGRDQGSFQFEIESLKEHIRFYLTLFDKAEQIQSKVKGIRALFFIFNTNFQNKFETEILSHLKKQFRTITVDVDYETKNSEGYYSDLRFNIFAQDSSGDEYFLVDGGFTDWTQQLLSNKKERLFTSGIGSERFVYCFGDKKNG